jgi:hypothetical protein
MLVLWGRSMVFPCKHGVTSHAFCVTVTLRRPAGLLCYMLVLSGRSPSKILFAKDSGRLFQLDLLVLYNDKGMVERIEVVPYRLTRNLATFFTAFGVEVRGKIF